MPSSRIFAMATPMSSAISRVDAHEPFHGHAAVLRLAVHFQGEAEASPALLATWLTETA